MRISFRPGALAAAGGLAAAGRSTAAPALAAPITVNVPCNTTALAGAITAAGAASTRGFSEFPAYSQVYLRNYNVWSFIFHYQDTLRAQLFPFYLYSYGRRLPGLRSGASPCG